MRTLQIGGREFSPELVIFDKDGTLIDFDFMWQSWIVELARRLEAAAGHPLTAELYEAIGYDSVRQLVIPGSPLAAASMAELYILCGKVAAAAGATPERAADAVSAVWYLPDPVRMARPLADLQGLFSVLRERDIRIAVATSDDRKATIATLNALGLEPLIDAVVTGDDGHPIKPAPDMLLHVCDELGVVPANCIMVGDSTADMQAAQNARIGLRVAVLSGVTRREQFNSLADVFIENVSELVAWG
jgi:phosphoglycolate phosphatase-like HAD superfamily hydrolase